MVASIRFNILTFHSFEDITVRTATFLYVTNTSGASCNENFSSMNDQYAARLSTIRLTLNLYQTLRSFKVKRSNFTAMFYEQK